MSAEMVRLARREGCSPALAAFTSLALAFGIGIAGCAPDRENVDDGVVETAHLRITTTTENPICAGTAPFLESEVVRIAEALELPLWAEDDRLDVRLGEDVVTDLCTASELEHLNGCVSREDSGLVVAAVEVANIVPHELVHAVRLRHFPLGHPLFEEGLAEILSGSDGFPRRVDYPQGEPHYGVEVMLDSSEPDFFHYVWGASFVSWLSETHSHSTLTAFMNDPRLPDDEMLPLLFEEYFGQSFAEADQAWAIDERPHATWGAPCIPERTFSLADGPVELSGNFDCDEPTVYGAAYFMSLWPMCLDVPQTTRVQLSLEAAHGQLQVLLREPCDSGPASAEAWRDKRVDAGDTVAADIVGCRFLMRLSSQEPGFPATPYTIRIEEIDR